MFTRRHAAWTWRSTGAVGRLSASVTDVLDSGQDAVDVGGLDAVPAGELALELQPLVGGLPAKLLLGRRGPIRA